MHHESLTPEGSRCRLNPVQSGLQEGNLCDVSDKAPLAEVKLRQIIWYCQAFIVIEYITMATLLNQKWLPWYI